MIARLPPPDFAIERGLIADGHWPIAGVDEAGRGPLAGPVAVAAVVLDPDDLPLGAHDSKALTAARREELFPVIIAKALAVSLTFIDAQRIDVINIRAATLHGMAQALAGLAVRPMLALIDGRDTPDPLCCRAQTLIKGDALSLSIAAASIIAKVARDRLMTRLDGHFPNYGFASHAGYPTRRHAEAIARHGPCPHHRMTFLD